MNDWIIARDIDVLPALTEIEAQPDLWDIFTLRQRVPGSAHRDTECIILRGPREFTIETVFDDLEAFDDPQIIARLPYTESLIIHSCRKYLSGYLLGRVMIVKLKSGGHITKHWDTGAYAAHYERFHLVLSSAGGNFIRSWATEPPLSFIPWPGILFKFPHLSNHDVFNLSVEPRIHIIIDARKP